MALSIRPMQWANLPELHQTAALDDSDLDCLEEIRGVLSRHEKLARFAVHLAHRHFELAPDEILIERPDPDGRTQHVTVGRRDDEPEARPTTWLFEEGPELRLSDAVYCVCVSDGLTKSLQLTLIYWHGSRHEARAGRTRLTASSHSIRILSSIRPRNRSRRNRAAPLES